MLHSLIIYSKLRYAQSSLSKIYPKIKDKFDNFDRLVNKKNI